MHKKSIEAAHKLSEEDCDLDELEPVAAATCDSAVGPKSQPIAASSLVNKDEFRSESIASLRAKAQTYSAQLRESIIQKQEMVDTNAPSSFEPPKLSDSRDSEQLDPAN